MKVGVYCAGFVGTAGGVEFIRVLVESLCSVENSNLQIHLLIPDRGPVLLAHTAMRVTKRLVRSLLTRRLRALPGRQSKYLLSETFVERHAQVKAHRIDEGRASLVAACVSLHIDIVFPIGTSLGRKFPIPWIGYIYDFQHRYFPGYFSSGSCKRRDAEFGGVIADAKAIIVNSRAVASDAAKFYPEGAADIVALPFSAAPHENWFVDQAGVKEKFQVGPKYFMISNQFWLHKRHDVAFAAFHEFVQTNSDMQLVCTGHTEDSRDPYYFARLMRYVNDHRLSEHVRILGLIPKRDQIELLKHSVAVIQPTCFEGGPGGGSVYDAISLGVPTVVSDIPVNREIARWVTTYFPLNDSNALCRAMHEIRQQRIIRKEAQYLREQGHERRRACGDVLLATLCKHAR
jgi:glycosyltransferase involved in cell wall biosynthesis